MFGRRPDYGGIDDSVERYCSLKTLFQDEDYDWPKHPGEENTEYPYGGLFGSDGIVVSFLYGVVSDTACVPDEIDEMYAVCDTMREKAAAFAVARVVLAASRLAKRSLYKRLKSPDLAQNVMAIFALKKLHEEGVSLDPLVVKHLDRIK